MEGEVKGKTFKMKGHTLPGINQRSETKNLADGRSKSSTFQKGIGDYEGEGSFALQVDPETAVQPVENVAISSPLGTPMNKSAAKFWGGNIGGVFGSGASMMGNVARQRRGNVPPKI